MSNSDHGPIPVYILDSWAVLAYLEEDSGAERVEAILREAEKEACQAYLSLINLGEVLYITEREQGLVKAQAALAAIDQWPVEILPIERETVLEAAHFKAQYPLAYADAFALAAAQSLDGIVVTGDPEFKAVEDLVQVEWL